MRTIAIKLGVANFLEGSVRKAGMELRITAQLIRASDGVHLWSQTYERTLNDIFKVQAEISDTVAKALNVALRGWSSGFAWNHSRSAATAQHRELGSGSWRGAGFGPILAGRHLKILGVKR